MAYTCRGASQTSILRILDFPQILIFNFLKENCYIAIYVIFVQNDFLGPQYP
jgi:hypothetical protein